jgi:glycosyltransferase involved in cell wall biosynthesis
VVAAPLVSCIVPVLDGERYLRESLDSILGQTYAPLEAIVADDGSTDGTAALVAAYGDRVRYLFQPNAGPAAACNLGLGAARGEFVAFLAADDLWHPEKLARQMARFAARPELDLSLAHLSNFWMPEVAEEARRFEHERLARPVPGYTCVTLLARRALFERVGGFDPALQHGVDFEWFLRAGEHGAVMELLPDVLVFRRLHRDNRSRRLAADSRDTFVRLVKHSLDRRRRLHGPRPPGYGFPGATPPGPAEGA